MYKIWGFSMCSDCKDNDFDIWKARLFIQNDLLRQKNYFRRKFYKRQRQYAPRRLQPFAAWKFFFSPWYFFLSPWYFSLSAKIFFITNFVTDVTNFLTHVTNFVIRVTNFVTNFYLADGENCLGRQEKVSRRKEMFAREQWRDAAAYGRFSRRKMKIFPPCIREKTTFFIILQG